jgi:uncharacterized membrane protein
MERLNSMKEPFYLLLIILIAGSLQSCYYDSEEKTYPGSLDGCDTIPPTFTNTIEAITSTNCAISGCHTGINPSAGIFLDTYAQVKVIADNGKLNQQVVVNKSMPPSGPLTDCERKAIADWIAAGAPEN